MARILPCEPGSRKVRALQRETTGDPMNSFANFFRTATATAAIALCLAPGTGHTETGAKTLRFIPQADLRGSAPGFP